MIDPLYASYRKYYRTRGHTWVPRYPLAHPGFKTSFVMSAGVIDMQQKLAGNMDGPHRCVVVQPCSRHFDLDAVGSGMHLSLFVMGAALYFDSPTRSSVLHPMIQFFVDELAIDSDKLWLTVFAGGQIDGYSIPADEESVAAWCSLNLPMAHITLNGPDKNFWREGAASGETRSGICGPHAELFFDRGIAGRCNARHCFPGCPCGRFLELANAVFPQYRFINRRLQVIPWILAEAAIGLDRVSMVIESVATVFDIKPLKALKDEASAGPLADGRGSDEFYTVLDHTRSFCCLVAEGAIPSRKGRGHLMRRIMRRCITAAEVFSSKPEDIVSDVAVLLLKHRESLAGIDLKLHWENVSLILERELRLFVTQRMKAAGA